MQDAVTAEDWLARKGKAAKLGLTLRSAVLSALPGIVEKVDVQAGTLTYGIDDSYEGTVVVIRPSGHAWTVGFYHGRDLPDPKKLLGGQGRVHATLTVEGREDAESKDLKQLLAAALDASRKRKGVCRPDAQCRQ